MAKRLYESLFDAQDANFVEALRAENDPAVLAKFIARWTADGRAWAHEQMFRYLDRPWDRPGHQPVIKRLFKWTEEQQNDELMAAFAVGCDRLVRRKRQQKNHYDWEPIGGRWMGRRLVVTSEETVLVSPDDVLRTGTRTRDYRNPRTGARVPNVPLSFPTLGKLFSYHTRYYLRRRAWRYFRWMGHRRPADYPLAIARALILYRDEDLELGENLLDSWTLMQACFREHPALEFGSSLIRIRAGHSLSELKPAPRFLELWQQPDSAEVLLLVVLEARSKPMRVWAMEMLREHHALHLGKLSGDELAELLLNPHEEVQQFGAELLENAEGLESWPLSQWMPLLEIKNLAALETICRLMAEKVSGDRLTLGDCLKLAAAEPAPIARMGFGYLKQRSIPADERPELSALSEAQCDAIAGDIARWALPLLGERPSYERDNVLPFFDSLSQQVRSSAWRWLLDDAEPANASAYEDPVFWCRLLETPFEDVRQHLIDVLDRRSQRTFPRPEAEALAPVWCSVLAGVHRGGRQKLKAVRQMAEAIEKSPARTQSLLPVLALALRSIRGPEMREALAAIVQVSETRPELAPAINKHLPEVSIVPIGETVW